MLLIPTTTPNAKFANEQITVAIQDDIQLRMTLHEAVRFAQSIMTEAKNAIHASRFVEPELCEVIPFPSKLARRG